MVHKSSKTLQAQLNQIRIGQNNNFTYQIILPKITYGSDKSNLTKTMILPKKNAAAGYGLWGIGSRRNYIKHKFLGNENKGFISVIQICSMQLPYQNGQAENWLWDTKKDK